jgi:hypothetical protein
MGQMPLGQMSFWTNVTEKYATRTNISGQKSLGQFSLGECDWEIVIVGIYYYGKIYFGKLLLWENLFGKWENVILGKVILGK